MCKVMDLLKKWLFLWFLWLSCWPLQFLDVKIHIDHRWSLTHIYLCCWPLLSCLLFFLLSCLMHDAKSKKESMNYFRTNKAHIISCYCCTIYLLVLMFCKEQCYCWVNMEFTFHTQTSATLIFKSWTFVLFVPEKSNFIWWQHFLLLHKRAEPILLSFSKHSTATGVQWTMGVGSDVL